MGSTKPYVAPFRKTLLFPLANLLYSTIMSPSGLSEADMRMLGLCLVHSKTEPEVSSSSLNTCST